jgi:hypothetical protein
VRRSAALSPTAVPSPDRRASVQQVQGVFARSKGGAGHDRDHQRAGPGAGGGAGEGARHAGATLTCTTVRAASTTTSRSSSGTRRLVWSRRSGRMRPRWRRETSSYSTGGRYTTTAGRATGRAVVLLQHLQRRPEDDPRGRHRALAHARHRVVCGEDACRRRHVHQVDPRGARRGWSGRVSMTARKPGGFICDTLGP